MKCRFFGYFSLWMVVTTTALSAECFTPACGVAEPNYCFEVRGDFLYWKADVESLPFGALVAESGTTVTSVDFKQGDFGYSPGFRLGGSWQYDCGWDLAVDWTRLHTATSGSLAPSSGVDVAPAWFALIFPVVSIHADQSFHYDFVNVDFVKTFALGSSFYCRPFFGGVGAFIHQSMKIQQPVITSTGPTVISPQTALLKNDFNGGGARVGLELDYFPCGWLSLYGRGSVALCYGGFTLDQSYTIASTPALTGGVNTHENAVVPGFDIMAGLKGSWCVCGYEILGHVSWEFVAWPNQVRLQTAFNTGSFAVSLRGHGDVTMQGLTTGLAVRF